VAFLYVMAAKKRAKGCYYYMEGIGLFWFVRNDGFTHK
jgi:hypothetical protein